MGGGKSTTIFCEGEKGLGGGGLLGGVGLGGGGRGGGVEEEDAKMFGLGTCPCLIALYEVTSQR